MQFLKFLFTAAIIGIVLWCFIMIFGLLIETFPSFGGFITIIVALFFVWLFFRPNENEDFTNH
ncbi:hypothetical protein SAMN05660493_01344 [Epilithonimonas bovis DSM 19482]|uniref:Uncharacterized protein n=1 Tax=Epilithonimonas bovis DSM 19482 TaxID=1121284 RepID=A0A1U7PXE6_9FLAO|nr:hypothetical protein SAMN05660493_01344 [Epilithonimonas bovis DSM 19482]